MKVHKGFEDFYKEGVEHAVVTTGTFDGVHIGHKTIIDSLKKIAKLNNGQTVLITFDPHPRMVLQKDFELKLISTIDERILLLEEAGLDHLIIIPFNKEFSRLSSLEFVRDILVNKIGTKTLVIGYDHHFGRNREGSFEHLLEYGPLYGFDVKEIPAQDVDATKVSSTKIREALLEGDISSANTYLGRDFCLTGKVISGDQIGRSLGFPTANIQINDKHKLIPKTGVYAVNINIDGEVFKGMLNIGNRPTVSSENRLSIEVHIFDFNEDLYNKSIVIAFIKRIRDENQFSSKEELIHQLEKDKLKCLEINSL